MKTIVKTLAVLGLLLSAVSFATRTSAGGLWKFRGESADGAFFFFDDCIYTDVWIYASDGVSQSPPGPPGSSSWTEVWINQWDGCTETTLLAANGGAELAPADFVVSHKMTSATLTATIPVYDWVSDTWMDAYVDLTWTGEGPLNRTSSTYQSNSPGCKYFSRWRGTNRPSSLTGSIVAGGMDYAYGESWGGIWKVSSGDMYVGCN